MYQKLSFNDNTYLTIPDLTTLGLVNFFTTTDLDFSQSHVATHLIKVLDDWELKPSTIWTGRQVHGDKIIEVSSQFENEYGNFSTTEEECDGLLTDQRQVLLFTKEADCLPIIIYDPVNKVQANVHSGWRGTLQEIGPKTLQLMVNNYKSDPKNLRIIFGPAIGAEDFEVQADVYQLFKDQFPKIQKAIKKKDDSHWLIDTKMINRRLLLELGIIDKHIYDINLSTPSTKYLHSYRRDGLESGRIGSFSMII